MEVRRKERVKIERKSKLENNGRNENWRNGRIAEVERKEIAQENGGT
jgi:hypothetical protein